MRERAAAFFEESWEQTESSFEEEEATQLQQAARSQLLAAPTVSCSQPGTRVAVKAHGGCCASLGHKFGFGSTLDQTLLKVLGCKERGHKSQGPLVHATGKGWVKEHKGQYYDALHVKNGIVKICLVESQGGIAPPTKRIIHNFAKEVGSPSAVDRTDYGTASGSARGFAQHHSQQLSRAAVCGDAQNINNAARNMRVAHSFMTGLNVVGFRCPESRTTAQPALLSAGSVAHEHITNQPTLLGGDFKVRSVDQWPC